MIRLVSSLLGVSDVESAQLRQQVAQAASGR